MRAGQNALIEERRQWKVRQEEAQRAIADEREQLAARSADFESQRDALTAERHALEAQRNALAEHHQQWHSQQEEAQRSINEQRDQLAAQLSQIESQWNALTEEGRQWQAKHQETQRGVDEQRERLAVQLAGLESQRAALAAEQNSLEAERQALAEQHRQWQVQQEAQQAADERQEQVDAQLAGLESQRAALAAERDRLEAERKALAEERRLWQVQQEAEQATRPFMVPASAGLSAELPPQDGTTNDEGRSLGSPAAADGPNGRADEDGTEPVNVAATLDSPATSEPQFAAPAERAPVDLNDVFRRIGAKVDLPDEQQSPPPTATEQTPRQTPAAQNVLHHPDGAGHAPRQASTALHAAEDDEEESIDDYMSRLMQRVRPGTGESQGPPRTTQHPERMRTGREASARPTAIEPSQPAAANTPPQEETEPAPARSEPRQNTSTSRRFGSWQTCRPGTPSSSTRGKRWSARCTAS